ncbi:MAG: 30S ribosomal protein S16 [Rickettsiaceae bacterium]|nr:30S ribosomal protein S16 [Rickettsiaceae bacterium]
MATKIRLARSGSKKRPYYRIVVANSLSPRDGDFIEKIGTYNPLLPAVNSTRVILKMDRLNYWLSKGAQPTEKVAIFIKKSGIEMPKYLVKLDSKREKAHSARRAKQEAEKEAKKAEAS